MQDIKDFLDSAENGTVYFSLGSNVLSHKLNNNTLEAITRAFASLPYKVLWKFESDYLPEKPENVMTKKWLPQQDVFGK